MAKDFLPKDKRLRMLVQVIIVIAGIAAMVSGVRQMRSGMGELSAAKAEVQGCRGVSATQVQCDYKNTGTVKTAICMDVVVICADGRHVAPGCSEPMEPGDSTSRMVENFDPEIQPATSCTSIAYEKMRTQT